MKLLRGSITIFLLLAVIVLGAVLLAGGIFPKENPETDPDAQEVIIDESSLATPSGKKSLQLQTLKFRECLGTITVDLLLDHTGSMNKRTPSGVTKIQRVKEAVLALVEKFTDTSVIGIQSFNSHSIREEVPISYYKDVKDIIPGKINALDARGLTPTHNALAFAYERLRDGMPRFLDRKFNFVFISDGRPEPPSGDPRLFTPDPVTQIKALGVNVYALAVYDSKDANDPALRGLMQYIASKPENYFEAETADETKRLLSSITEKICQAAK